MQYLGSNKLYDRTIFRIFIAHYGLHDAQSPDLKTRGQLGAFPHKINGICLKFYLISLFMIRIKSPNNRVLEGFA